MLSREEQLRLWKLKKHGGGRQENRQARPSELKNRRRSMSKAAQASVAAKTKALQSNEGSTNDNTKQQKRKSVAESDPLSNVVPKALSSRKINGPSALRVLDSNSMHRMMVAQEEAGLGTNTVKKSNKRLKTVTVCRVELPPRPLQQAQLQQKQQYQQEQQQSPRPFRAARSFLAPATLPGGRRVRFNITPGVSPPDVFDSPAESSHKPSKTKQFKDQNPKQVSEKEYVPPFPQRTPLRKRSVAPGNGNTTAEVLLSVMPSIAEERAKLSTPTRSSAVVRLGECATAQLQRTRARLEKPLAKLGPAPKSARKPTRHEMEGLTMREKLALFKAEREEQKQLELAARESKMTPGPKLGTLMLAAKARIKAEDWFGAENIFARIANSKVLSRDAFKKADFWVMRAYACEKLGRYDACVTLFQQAQVHKPRPFAPFLKSFQRFKDTYWQAVTGKDWPPMVNLSLSFDDSDDEDEDLLDQTPSEFETSAALVSAAVPMDVSSEVMERRQEIGIGNRTPVANSLKKDIDRALTMTGLCQRAGIATPIAHALHTYMESKVHEGDEQSEDQGLGHIGTPFTNFLHSVEATGVQSEWNKDSPPTKLHAKSKPQPLVRKLADAMQDTSVDQGQEDVATSSQDPLSLTTEMEEIKSFDSDTDESSYTTPTDDVSSAKEQQPSANLQSIAVPVVPENEQVTEAEVAEMLEKSKQAATIHLSDEGQEEPCTEVEHVSEEEIANMLKDSIKDQESADKGSSIIHEVVPCLGAKSLCEPEKGGSFIALQPVKSRVKADEKQNSASNWEYLLSPVRRSSRFQPKQNMSDVLQLLAATQYSYSPNPALSVQSSTLSPIVEGSCMDKCTPKKDSKKVCGNCLSSRARSYTRHPQLGLLCKTCLREAEPRQRSDTPRPTKTNGLTAQAVFVQNPQEQNKQRALPPVPLFDGSSTTSHAVAKDNALDCKHTRPVSQKRKLPPVPVFAPPAAVASRSPNGNNRKDTPIPTGSRSRTKESFQDMGIVTVKIQVAGASTPVRRSARNKRRRKNVQ